MASVMAFARGASRMVRRIADDASLGGDHVERAEFLGLHGDAS